MSYDPNQVAALAERNMAHLLQAGEEALNFSPLVTLEGPATGTVLWGDGDSKSQHDNRP